MKSKNRASSRRKINFAVDRDEIEVNSDWVDAVMAGPVLPRAEAPPAAPNPLSPTTTPHGESADPSLPASDRNSATGAESEPGAGCSSVERSAPGKDSAPEEDNPSGAESATVAESAAAVESATGPQVRWRPRPIRRITDGLTPGQYAVYRLMYEEGQGSGSSRIYTGGYADLRRLTGLSKRGIQNIIAELQTKQVIAVHHKPGYHRTETTSYLVPDAAAVVEAWFARGWRHALGKSKALLVGMPPQ